MIEVNVTEVGPFTTALVLKVTSLELLIIATVVPGAIFGPDTVIPG